MLSADECLLPPGPSAELEEPDVAVTLFAPILTNVTAPQAAAYPQLLLDIILPEVYSSVRQGRRAAGRRE